MTFKGFPKAISAKEIEKYFYFAVESNGSKIIETCESWGETHIQT